MISIQTGENFYIPLLKESQMELDEQTSEQFQDSFINEIDEETGMDKNQVERMIYIKTKISDLLGQLEQEIGPVTEQDLFDAISFDYRQ